MLFAHDETDNVYSSNISTVYIYKNLDGSQWDNLNIGDKVALFDSLTPYESWNHDECYVGDIDRSSCPDYAIVYLTLSDLSTPYTTKCSYTASPWISDVGRYPDFSLGSSAGIGVVYSTTVIDGQIVDDIYGNQINGAGSAFYEADMRAIKKTYDDAYVEFVGLRNGMGAVPYLPQDWFNSTDSTQLCYFSQEWFTNFRNDGGTPPYAQSRNYFHLIGASKKAEGTTITNGLTWSPYDWTYIFVDSISDACTFCSEKEIELHIQETTCHEKTHQFDVNYCDSGGHDQNYAWCNGDPTCTNSVHGFEYCIMHAYDETYSLDMRKDGIVKLDCDDLNGTGSSCGIPSCSNGISVRTNVDPE